MVQHKRLPPSTETTSTTSTTPTPQASPAPPDLSEVSTEGSATPTLDAAAQSFDFSEGVAEEGVSFDFSEGVGPEEAVDFDFSDGLSEEVSLTPMAAPLDFSDAQVASEQPDHATGTGYRGPVAKGPATSARRRTPTDEVRPDGSGLPVDTRQRFGEAAPEQVSSGAGLGLSTKGGATAVTYGNDSTTLAVSADNISLSGTVKKTGEQDVTTGEIDSSQTNFGASLQGINASTSTRTTVADADGTPQSAVERSLKGSASWKNQEVSLGGGTSHYEGDSATASTSTNWNVGAKRNIGGSGGTATGQVGVSSGDGSSVSAKLSLSSGWTAPKEVGGKWVVTYTGGMSSLGGTLGKKSGNGSGTVGMSGSDTHSYTRTFASEAEAAAFVQDAPMMHTIDTPDELEGMMVGDVYAENSGLSASLSGSTTGVGTGFGGSVEQAEADGREIHRTGERTWVVKVTSSDTVGGGLSMGNQGASLSVSQSSQQRTEEKLEFTDPEALAQYLESGELPQSGWRRIDSGHGQTDTSGIAAGMLGSSFSEQQILSHDETTNALGQKVVTDVGTNASTLDMNLLWEDLYDSSESHSLTAVTVDGGEAMFRLSSLVDTDSRHDTAKILSRVAGGGQMSTAAVGDHSDSDTTWTLSSDVSPSMMAAFMKKMRGGNYNAARLMSMEDSADTLARQLNDPEVTDGAALAAFFSETGAYGIEFFHATVKGEKFEGGTRFNLRSEGDAYLTGASGRDDIDRRVAQVRSALEGGGRPDRALANELDELQRYLDEKYEALSDPDRYVEAPRDLLDAELSWTQRRRTEVVTLTDQVRDGLMETPTGSHEMDADLAAMRELRATARAGRDTALARRVAVRRQDAYLDPTKTRQTMVIEMNTVQGRARLEDAEHAMNQALEDWRSAEQLFELQGDQISARRAAYARAGQGFAAASSGFVEAHESFKDAYRAGRKAAPGFFPPAMFQLPAEVTVPEPEPEPEHDYSHLPAHQQPLHAF